MTDNVELKSRFTRIFNELLSIYGPLFDQEGPIIRGGPGSYSPGGPPPTPWRSRFDVGQTTGAALILAAQLKVAGQMAGNDALVDAAEGRITKILDDDWCATYRRVIKLPPAPPVGTDPPPRPNWKDFEALVAIVLEQHQILPDGAQKDELGVVVKQIAAPG